MSRASANAFERDRLPVTAGLANSAKLAKLATDAAKGVGFIEVPPVGKKIF
jgi:hypothetical protein